MSEESGFREDPSLARDEKQFSVVGTKGDDELRIHSEVASVVRRLLNHDGATVENVREGDEGIHACTVTLPLNYLSIKSEPRSSGNWSNIVSQGVMDDE